MGPTASVVAERCYQYLRTILLNEEGVSVEPVPESSKYIVIVIIVAYTDECMKWIFYFV